MAAKKRTAKKAAAGKTAARKKAPKKRTQGLDTLDKKESLTAPQKRVLTKLKASAFNTSKACEAAKVARQSFYNWFNGTPAFRQAVDDIREKTVDHLEDVVIDRAINGWEEDVFDKDGCKCGTKLRFDNTLTWKVLQSLRAKHYRDRKPDDAQTLAIKLPKVTDAKTCMAAAAAVLAEVAAGKVPVDQAKSIMDMVDKTRAAIETNDLAERLEALEDQLAETDDDD